MFCNNCSQQIEDDATVCVHCGESNPQGVRTVESTPYLPQKKEIKPMLSMILGIAGIVMSCCCTFAGIGLGIAAAVIGGMCMSQKLEPKGQALAGLITGIAAIVISIAAIIISIVMGVGLNMMEMFY